MPWRQMNMERKPPFYSENQSKIFHLQVIFEEVKSQQLRVDLDRSDAARCLEKNWDLGNNGFDTRQF